MLLIGSSSIEEDERMRASRGEIKIEEILKEAELPFKMEYIFPDLKSPNGRPLRFDFVVFDDDGRIDFIIEYQGKQQNQILKVGHLDFLNLEKYIPS